MKNLVPEVPGMLRRCVLRTAAVSLLLAAGARAQSETPPVNEGKEPVVKLDEIIVTGSNLPSAGETPVAPVTLLTNAALESSGVTSDLLQVIRKTAPQFTGNKNLGGDNGNIQSGSTNGGSQLSLRNAATLVLVNGRRVAAAPVAATGGGVFVDVNAIPISAIARVEILTDGASAIYGTDAVSGVVNIILKTDFSGAEAGGRYAVTDNLGHYSERSAYGIVGGQVGAKGPRITASYEWVKVDPVFNYQRGFATPVYGTTNFAGVIQTGSFATGGFVGDPNGYYFLDPSLNAPKAGATLVARGYTGPLNTGAVMRLFDLANYVTMLIGNEKRIATFAVDEQFSRNLAFFGDILVSTTKTVSQLNAQPLSVRMAAADPNNVLGQDISVRNRFVDHPRLYQADTSSIRGVAGLRGRFDEQWSWESAIDYSRGVQDFANENLVRTAARVSAVNAGTINLFARDQNSGAVDGLFGSASGRFCSTLASWDFKFVGTDLVKLPAGGLNLAVGGETRVERLTATSDVDSQSATFAYDSGTTIDPFEQKRHITSIFAETSVPLVGSSNRLPGVYSADLTVAARHERYSDTDNPTVPKVALRWQPVDNTLLFRATYSKSFAAPTLYQLNSPTGIGFTSTLAEFDSNQANQQSLAVTGLAPSHSTNISVGAVWSPKVIPNLLISVDYFRVKQTDVVSSLGATGVVDQVFHDVETLGSASRYAPLIHIGSFTGPTVSAPGQISALGLDNIYFSIPAASNLGASKMSGLDIRASYTVRLPGTGKLKLESDSSYYQTYDIQVAPGAPYTPTAGRVTGLNGTIPRWRAYNTISYTNQAFTAELGHTFYCGTTDTTWTPDFLPDYQQRIPSYSTFDVSLGYELKFERKSLPRVKIVVGVNNIANKMPPKSATFDTLSNADITEFNPIGRMYFMSASVKF
jgi:iron complex outermembrane recepter protein